MTKSLKSLRPGESGVLLSLSDERFLTKLMTLGLFPGSIVKLVRYAPFGGSVYVKVNNNQIALRNEEASLIFIEKKHD